MRIRRQLEQQQREWAQRRGLELTGGSEEAPLARVARLEDNFFTPLDERTQLQLLHGAGGELTAEGGGHLYSLASSQALCLNVLAPWREQPAAVVEALGLEAEARYAWEFDARLRFSPKRTETAPVDVLLKPQTNGGTAAVIAMEAKFAEAYDGKPRRALGHYYRTRKDLIAGWTHMARLVRDEAEKRFRYFDLSQTMRQFMALRQNFGRSRFVLAYLWYEAPGREGREFAVELDEIRVAARQDGIAFLPVAWGELVARLPGDAQWRAYLKERYGL